MESLQFLVIKYGGCVYLVDILPFQIAVSHVGIIQHFNDSICQGMAKRFEIHTISCIDPHHGWSPSKSSKTSTGISSDPGQFGIVEYGEWEQPICYDNHLECVSL